MQKLKIKIDTLRKRAQWIFNLNDDQFMRISFTFCYFFCPIYLLRAVAFCVLSIRDFGNSLSLFIIIYDATVYSI